MDFREKMMTGSYMAGLGLAMAGVGAVHALSYPMGSLFGIPHGVANACLLPYVLEYNYPGNIEKFCNVSIAMGQDEDGLSSRELASMAAEAAWDLAEDIGTPLTLKELNIPEDAIPDLVKGAMKIAVPIMNNPRPMTPEVAEKIYRQAFES
jgi:alcohol dehydrogenase class IV